MSRSRSSWRDHIRPLVAAAIEEGRSQGLDGKALELFMRGKGRGPTSWGYKVWLSEVDEQLRDGRTRKRRQARKRAEREPGQGLLFAEVE